MDELNPYLEGIPNVQGPLGQAVKAVYVLKSGGRFFDCNGLPLCFVINTKDRGWLAQVTSVTMHAAKPGTSETKFWNGEIELPRPSDLTEIIISDIFREFVVNEGTV